MKIHKFGNLKLYEYKPTIIAEVGVNHNCDLKLAKKYIRLCKESRADAVKFQTYKADKIVAKKSPAYWDMKEERTKTQYELFKKYDKFNYKEYLSLFKECKKKKIKFMSTLFDLDSIDEYSNLIKVFKVSSSDINNYPLLKKISLQKKHIILSTGGSSLKEIKKALRILNLPKRKVCIMHCVLNYPTLDKFANLKFIQKLKREFPEYIIGYSDHVKSDSSLTQVQLAYEFGAQIIEKHFTHNKKLRGNDHYHSMDKDDLLNFQKIMERRKILQGKEFKNLYNEIKSIKYARRAIYAKKNIQKFKKISSADIIPLRPCVNGVSVSRWNTVIGKRLNRNLKTGDIFKESYFN